MAVAGPLWLGQDSHGRALWLQSHGLKITSRRVTIPFKIYPDISRVGAANPLYPTPVKEASRTSNPLPRRAPVSLYPCLEPHISWGPQAPVFPRPPLPISPCSRAPVPRTPCPHAPASSFSAPPCPSPPWSLRPPSRRVPKASRLHAPSCARSGSFINTETPDYELTRRWVLFLMPTLRYAPMAANLGFLYKLRA